MERGRVCQLFGAKGFEAIKADADEMWRRQQDSSKVLQTGCSDGSRSATTVGAEGRDDAGSGFAMMNDGCKFTRVRYGAPLLVTDQARAGPGQGGPGMIQFVATLNIWPLVPSHEP